MTIEQKFKISKEITQSLSRIDYYKTGINRIKKYPQSFYSGEFSIRLAGVKSNVWGELSIDECLKILRSRLSKEENQVKELAKKIK